MAVLNLIDDIKKVEERLNSPEEMLGRGLLQPFSAANSGARKIMHGTQLEQRLPLMHAEVPLIQTGYENQFGENSSSFIRADSDYKVIAKIPKFSSRPNHHYYLILKDEENKKITVLERISYKHITETYGYLYDNDRIDTIEVGNTIWKGEVVQKSKAFDAYNNRMDGVNLTTAYLSAEATMEDGIIISESAAKKLVSPLLKHVSIIINDNDIPLNIYGDESNYKTFPDIGDNIEKSILCAIRREKKEEALFSQSYNKLRDLMMSDDRFTLEGRVVDIDVRCNNPANIHNSFYNNQLSYYYDDSVRLYNDIINAVDMGVSGDKEYQISYDLQKLYFNCKKILSGGQYIIDRPFSNIVLDIMVLEENKIMVGDKLTDRYGGKGVVSQIRPDYLMPRNEDNTPIDLIKNQATCVNRLNPAQLFEQSLNHISDRIIQYIQIGVLDVSQCAEMLLRYFELLSPELAEYVKNMLDTFETDDDVIEYMGSISADEGIILSLKPISDQVDIDKLNMIYQEFPWATLNKITVPIIDSNGNVRYIPARRPIVVGKIYNYRLKQYAEEKFSATSLSSTNIRNENSRNKSNRAFKSTYTKTPIRFGEMEIGDLTHVGVETVIVNLMLHSSSPHARRLSEQLLTGDPFNIDIKLDSTAKNRSVEIVQAYLKTMGLKLVFTKKRKELIKPFYIKPFNVLQPTDIPHIKPFTVLKEGETEKDVKPAIKPFFIRPFKVLEPSQDITKKKRV